MYQIDVPTAATTQPASSALGTTGFFTDGNAATGVPATVVPAEFLNSIMLELTNTVTGAGLALSKSSFNQLYTAIQTLIQQSGLRASAWTPLNANTTLAPSNCGQTVAAFGTTSFSINLPLSSACPVGARVELVNAASASVNLFRQGSTDQIVNNVSTVTQLVMGQGDTVTFENAGGGKWYVVGGSLSLLGASVFGASLGSPGYQKLPSGWIFEWGVCSLPASGVNSSSVAVTFPLAFPNAAFVTGSPTSTANTTAGGQPSFGAQNITKNGFSANGDALNYTTFNKVCTCIWFAIGY